ncbi:MAG TPA: hypothetical protein PLD99_00065 [Parcubacteria group bacterium]|nr:hypothetical protein [Parcubacteria group bacterium]
MDFIVRNWLIWAVVAIVCYVVGMINQMSLMVRMARRGPLSGNVFKGTGVTFLFFGIGGVSTFLLVLSVVVSLIDRFRS